MEARAGTYKLGYLPSAGYEPTDQMREGWTIACARGSLQISHLKICSGWRRNKLRDMDPFVSAIDDFRDNLT